MASEVIIDTNVPLIADGDSHMSLECQSHCLDFIQQVMYGGKTIVVIDDQFHVLGEYERQKDRNRADSLLEKLFIWVHTHQTNPAKVKQVPIRSTGEGDFEEISQKIRDLEFDPSDRKFVAVCIANDKQAPIYQAADSKWIGWDAALKEEGIEVCFLCREELEQIYRNKMTGVGS